MAEQTLQACLNGARTREEHPRVPRTPDELAREARAAVAAGANALHVHAYDSEGRETLDAGPCAAAVQAVRAVCPRVPVSLSTSAAIVADPRARLDLIAGWTELPDLVSANQGEPGIVELCEHLLARGVGIEAGLLHIEDARAFAARGLSGACARVLVEPLDADPAAAAAHAAAMEETVLGAGIALEQVHHGDGPAHWAVLARAIARGYGIRSGLEDTTTLPDGSQPSGNADLVRAAAEMLAAARITSQGEPEPSSS